MGPLQRLLDERQNGGAHDVPQYNYASACRGMLAEPSDARTCASGRSDKQVAARHIAVNLSDGCALHMPAAVQLSLTQALWKVSRALHGSRERIAQVSPAL